LVFYARQKRTYVATINDMKKKPTKKIEKPKVEEVKAALADEQKQLQETEETLKRKIEAVFKLSDIERAILSIKVRYPSIGLEQLSLTLGYSRQHLSEKMNSPAFKSAMAEYTKNLIDALVDAQCEAVRRLKKECQNPDPEIAISAAKALLIPLGRVENNSPAIQQNVVYSVRFGDGGQLYKEMRPMTVEDFQIERR
jgi:hypothetical protein